MVRSVGVASAAAALALGVAGTASACSITEFTSASITCDTQSGQGVITVLDQDSSGTKVDISVLSGGKSLATQSGITGTREGVKVTFPGIAWTKGETYTVHVVKSGGRGDVVGDKTVTAQGDCSAPTTPPSSPAAPPSSPSKPSTPASAPSTSPTAAPTTSGAAAVADTSSPSPSGNLAETGGGSNTGMIAGVAAVLVALGGGAVFMLRRRTPSARH